MLFHLNTLQSSTPRPRAHLLSALGIEGRAEAMRFLAACPRHAPTPLHALPATAAALGLGQLHIKDEGHRLGLKSFKALGGAYAVIRLVIDGASSVLGRQVQPEQLMDADVRAIARGLTFACATDGNHGRSVAAGARLVGSASVIFMHEGVSEARAEAIAAFGARIERVAGSYDDSVREAARQADRNGWTIVSDTSWAGYEDIPLLVMQGYTLMAGEAFDSLPEPPTHIFIQAGVGGVAAAVAAHASAVYGNKAPRLVVVEPESAACLLASARAGRATAVSHEHPTIMAMLECAEPSPLAFEVLRALAHAFVALPDESAVDAMNRLVRPPVGDPPIIAGESGCAGFAGLLLCLADRKACAELGLDNEARILLFNTEGATDPALYQQLTGIDPAIFDKG